MDVTDGNKVGRQYLGTQPFNVRAGQTRTNVDAPDGAILDEIDGGYSVVVHSRAPAQAPPFDDRVISAESEEVEEPEEVSSALQGSERGVNRRSS